MHVGIPTEIKNNEYRVAITPAGVAELIKHGHEVLIQAGAGEGSAIADNDFKAAGAQIVTTADQVWAESDLLLKVKEPIAAEYHRMRKGQTLFTYLHLAASRECTDALLTSGTTAIAYETVQTADGRLPLLAPMSEVAGRLSAQVGAYHLMRSHGGRGVLMGGVPGVAPANVVVIGGGTAGFHAAQIASGMGAQVTVFDLNLDTLRRIDAARSKAMYAVMPKLRGDEKPPEGVDAPAVNAILLAALHYLTLRGATMGGFSGLPLKSEADWKRVMATFQELLARTYAQD